jgi:hypothetical protein
MTTETPELRPTRLELIEYMIRGINREMLICEGIGLEKYYNEVHFGDLLQSILDDHANDDET